MPGTYGNEVDDLQVLAQGHLARWWDGAVNDRGEITEGDLLRQFDEIQRLYGEQAAYAAADHVFYQRSLDESLADMPYPSVSSPVRSAQYGSSFSWAVWPMMEHRDAPSAAVAMTRLSGLLSRLVPIPARETVITAALEAGTGIDRLPNPGACDWCLEAASYGPAYDAADMQHRSMMHERCRCVIVELGPGDEQAQINLDLQGVWTEAGDTASFRDVIDRRRDSVNSA